MIDKKVFDNMVQAVNDKFPERLSKYLAEDFIDEWLITTDYVRINNSVYERLLCTKEQFVESMIERGFKLTQLNGLVKVIKEV